MQQNARMRSCIVETPLDLLRVLNMERRRRAARGLLEWRERD
jgi:hypothetical protein